ncbi:TPA: hypothetical protein ACGFBB_000739 [Escherichia coli]|nr:hypothetical protein [Escherichia coli]
MDLTDAMKKVNDILTAFAKGVLYRESGVLNSHQLSVDILKIIGEGECRGVTTIFIKIFRSQITTVHILHNPAKPHRKLCSEF